MSDTLPEMKNVAEKETHLLELESSGESLSSSTKDTKDVMSISPSIHCEAEGHMSEDTKEHVKNPCYVVSGGNHRLPSPHSEAQEPMSEREETEEHVKSPDVVSGGDHRLPSPHSEAEEPMSEREETEEHVKNPDVVSGENHSVPPLHSVAEEPMSEREETEEHVKNPDVVSGGNHRLPSPHSEAEEPMSETEEHIKDPDVMSGPEHWLPTNCSETEESVSETEETKKESGDENCYSEENDFSQNDSDSSRSSSPLSSIGEEPSPKRPAVEHFVSDTESEQEIPVQEYSSKNGQIKWYDQPVISKKKSPTKRSMPTPGPTRIALYGAKHKDIKSIFKLFLPSKIIKIILAMSNLEGKRIYGEQWKDMDEIALDAYIGLLLLAGVCKSRGEAVASLWKADTGRAIFPATMSQGQFSVFTRVLRFNKHGEAKTDETIDKLAPIREVWDMWVAQLPLMYHPGRNVTVDERMVPFRGRCPFRQYMPRKPAKYGMKIWVACDAQSSYAFNMQIYLGKLGGAPEKGQGKRVILDMVGDLPRGHMITMDNFFTSYALAEELLKRKITMLGTIRKNKPELPPHILNIEKRKLLSSVFLFSDKATLVSYYPKKNKNVVLLSTEHKEAEICSRRHKKPKMIMDYNATKGAVDTLDKCTGSYSCQRRSLRWPMALFANMIDVSAYNAFVIWNEWTEQTGLRRQFLEQLGKELVKPFVEQRTSAPRSAAARDMSDKIAETSAAETSPMKRKGTDKLESLRQSRVKGGRKRCKLCPCKLDRKSTRSCAMCKHTICNDHLYIFCGSCCP